MPRRPEMTAPSCGCPDNCIHGHGPSAAAIAYDRRDEDGQRLYVLLALFDTRDGSYMADLVRSAREGWERSHPDMGEDSAWDEFDHLWADREDLLPRRRFCVATETELDHPQ